MVVRSAEELEQLRAAHLDEVAALDREQAARNRGDRGEACVRRLLTELESEGWVALHSRHWPGTRRADLDHVLIGPGGVVILDTKSWRGPVRYASGRLTLGQDDVTSELHDVATQVQAVQEVLEPLLLSPVQVVGAMVFVGKNMPTAAAGAVHIVDDDTLLRWLRSLGQRLLPHQVADAATVVDQAVPPHNAPARQPVPLTRPRPKGRHEQQDALFDLGELDLDELERAAKLGVEEWMTYLHPSQLDVVRRQANGPSRLRGPAGCGKTVVALHRAAHLLAREQGDLLFLTYVRTLPAVFGNLYERLSPHTASRTSFVGLHAFAMGALRECGQRVRIDTSVAETCMSRAWAAVGRAQLETPSLPRSYWEEEIQHIIKGRGLREFSEYAELQRTGRRTRLTPTQRAAVWDMYVRYDDLLRDKGVHDFADVINAALEASLRGAIPRYRFVVVDEAQDLSLQAVRFAASLVEQERDGLTLVGDGQQAVYAGGYTLKEAGISVAGRSSVLSVNYRNTREVLEAAQGVVISDDFDDLEGLGESGQRSVEVVRSGAAVCTVLAQDAVSADAALVRRLLDDEGLSHAGAAVLCRTVAEERRVIRLLGGHGIPAISLEDYTGAPVAAVKVGTSKRAKGLEFPRVYLPRTDEYLTTDGDAEVERVERERRELFVAMTRARDGLWTCSVAARSHS